MTDGSHRRRVEHVRARLRERVWVQPRLLKVPLIDRLLAHVRRQIGVDWGLERAARRAQTVNDLFAATTESAVSDKFLTFPFPLFGGREGRSVGIVVSLTCS